MIYDYFICNIRLHQGDNLSPVCLLTILLKKISTAYGGLNIAQSWYPSLMNS